MHNAFVAGAYVAFGVWLLLSGALSLASHRSGRRNLNYLVLALVNIFMSVALVSFGAMLLYAAKSDSERFVLLWKIGFTASLLSSAALLHFAVQIVRRTVPTTVWSGIYALTALLTGALWVEGIHLSTDHTVMLSVFVASVRTYTIEPGTVFLLGTGANSAAVFVAVVLFGVAYMRGKQGTLLVFIAMGVLGLAVLNDWLFFGLGRSSLLFVPIAFSLLDGAIAYGFVKRYSMVREKVVRQRKKLSLRSSELQKSHEALNVVRSELGKKEQLAAIGEMASIIAHEVRNPLAVISNASSSLKKSGLRQEDRETLLSILEEETARLNRLVSDLLNYARPITPQRQRLLLLDLLQQTAVRVDKGGVEVDVAQGAAKGQIWADADLLRQTFDNLVMNAIQATGEGGLVTLDVKPEKKNGRDGYLVTITDDGEGMDTMIRKRAKDPFFTTRPTGTGLGLAIVGRIIEAHSGEMWFDSHAGEGTTVSIFLPLGVDRGVPASQRIRDTLPPVNDEPSVGD